MKKIVITKLDHKATTTLTECTDTISNCFLEGEILKIQLDNFFYVSQSLKVFKKSYLVTKHKCCFFKLHFELTQKTEYISFDSSTSSSKNITINKGTYLLTKCNEKDIQIVEKTERKNTVEIFFKERFLETLVAKEHTKFLNKKTPCVTSKIPVNIYPIIDDITHCPFNNFERKTFLELKLKELLIISLANYVSSLNQIDIHLKKTSSLIEVETYIKNHLKEQLTINKLSLIAGLNTNKFKQDFKKTYGTTVFKYITQLRIDKAKELILKEDYPISQVSYEVGYKNPQHFTVAFKKHTGYLPSHLKKKH